MDKINDQAEMSLFLKLSPARRRLLCRLLLCTVQENLKSYRIWRERRKTQPEQKKAQRVKLPPDLSEKFLTEQLSWDEAQKLAVERDPALAESSAKHLKTSFGSKILPFFLYLLLLPVRIIGGICRWLHLHITCDPLLSSFLYPFTDFYIFWISLVGDVKEDFRTWLDPTVSENDFDFQSCPDICKHSKN